MSSEVITHTCGHKHEHILYGTRKDREWKAKRRAEEICPSCWQRKALQEREKTAEAGKQAGNEYGLPELIGTEKQLLWANQIRGAAIPLLDRARSSFESIEPATAEQNGCKHAGLAYIDKIFAEANASWWIEHRTTFEVMTRPEAWLSEKVRNAPPIPLDKTAEEIEAERELSRKMQEAAELEATIFPESQITNLVAEIKVLADGRIAVSYADLSEKLREIVRELGYGWDKDIRLWVKRPRLAPDDRKVEVAHKLLVAGFPVRLFDPELRRRAQAGEYSVEVTRFISVREDGKYKGWFVLRWSFKEDYYAAARKLPGSHYSKPNVVLPPQAWQEVVDFAEVHSFLIQDCAKAIIEAQEELSRSSIKVQIQARKEEAEPVKTAEPEFNPAKVEVPDALKD